MNTLFMYSLLSVIQMLTAIGPGAIPGTFYWRPRKVFLYPSKGREEARTVKTPTKYEIEQETVVLIDGFSLGLTALAVTAGYYAAKKPFLHLHPRHASYYTNAYRWGLRHLSLVRPWLSGMGGSYIDTHKVWRRRFHYMSEFVPIWLRRVTPWVEKEEWDDEEKFMRQYKFFAEPAFGKHYMYPTAKYKNFESQQTLQTLENLEDSRWPS